MAKIRIFMIEKNIENMTLMLISVRQFLKENGQNPDSGSKNSEN